MVLENLRKVRVQNTRQAERLKFDSLDPYAGEWIHGQETYAATDGTPKRAAISIGWHFAAAWISQRPRPAGENAAYSSCDCIAPVLQIGAGPWHNRNYGKKSMKRRDFLTGVAAVASASTAAAQPKPEEKSEQQSDADALLDLVRRRYGLRLSAEQLATIRNQLTGNRQTAKALAATPLANGDGPLLEPSAFYRSLPEPK